MHLFNRSLSGSKQFRRRRCFIATATLALAATAWANTASAAPKADLSRVVVIGDSLAAGFQSFSLYDNASIPGNPSATLPPGGQRYGLAALIAKQAGVDLKLPLLYAPGLPPVLTFDGTNIAPSVPPPGLSMYRVNPGEQTLNLAVPGVTLGEALARPFPGDPEHNAIDALSYFILGVPGNAVPGCGPIPAGSSLIVSQLTCAAALKPTTVIVGIGNNDALGSLTFGTLPTATDKFRLQYRSLLAGLALTRASIVVANIPDVTAVPFLVSADGFRAACPGMDLPAGMTDADYVVPNLAAPEQGFSICANPSIRPAALINAAKKAVSDYNSIIASEAQRVGAAVVDVYSLMNRVSKDGYKLNNGKILTSRLGGGIYSLDFIHPSNTGYAILANEFIKSMNANLKTKIPAIVVDDVAAQDPLIFPLPTVQ